MGAHAQVEAALCSHPAVAAAAVVGVPDARWGEAVAAVVALRPGWGWSPGGAVVALDGGGATCGGSAEPGALGACSAAALQSHCREVAGLSPYKVPRLVAASWPAGAGLPVNASGKVVKARVREALLAAGAAGQGHQGGPRSRL